MTPATVFGMVLFAYALTWVPDKYRPAWTQRLNSWQTWLGLVALVIAVFIVMNPEFYALGMLGDSAFFDLLVLAITLQLQMTLARGWQLLVAGCSKVRRFVAWRVWVTRFIVIWTFGEVVSAIHKVVNRITF